MAANPIVPENESYYDAAPTVRLPRIPARAFIFLSAAARFLICLAAIWMGMAIAVHGPNDGTAILAALACGGVIYGLLGRTRA